MRSKVGRQVIFAGLAALAAMLSAGAARAGTVTIFNNFGPGESFNSVHGNFIGFFNFPSVVNYVPAMPFTAGQTADLTGAVLPLVWTGGIDFPLTVFLESNSGGVPGSVLATLTQQGTIANVMGLVNFDYTGTPVEVTAGTSYWLVTVQTQAFAGDTSDGWGGSSTVNATIDFNQNGSATGPWGSTSPSIISAFELDGSPVATASEPASLLLLAIGLLGLAPLLRRRVKAAWPG